MWTYAVVSGPGYLDGDHGADSGGERCMSGQRFSFKDVVLTSGMGVPLLIGTDVLETNTRVLDYSQNVLVLGNV